MCIRDRYPYFRYLMQYMNRVSHLINGGIHVPCVGLFYNACAEWAGEYEPFEEAGMILSREQIDYEVLPEDVLKECRCENGRLIAGREPLNALIFPYCEYLPQYLLDWCTDASAKGLEIIFLEKSPKVLETGETFDCAGSIVLSKEILAPYLRKTGAAELMCAPKAPDLRYYHYRQQDGEFYLFFNESANRAVETEVWLPLSGRNCCRYDAFDNCLYVAEHEDNRLKLRLSPYEAYILYVGDVDEGCVPAAEGWEEKAAFEPQSPLTCLLYTSKDCVKNVEGADWVAVKMPPAEGVASYKPGVALNVYGYMYAKKGIEHPEAVVKMMNQVCDGFAAPDLAKEPTEFYTKFNELALDDAIRTAGPNNLMPFQMQSNINWGEKFTAAVEAGEEHVEGKDADYQNVISTCLLYTSRCV